MIVIHDSRLPEVYLKGIHDRYPDCVALSFGEDWFNAENKVYSSIKFHPDIFFFKLDARTVIYSPGINREKLQPIADLGVSLIEGVKQPEGRYPFTCGYNVLKVGSFLFHRLEYMDPVILEQASMRGYKPVHVNQGYTGCSSVVAGGNAVITADSGVRKAAENENVDTLFISPADVLLPGEKRGFLGGASGNLPEGTIVFSGDITRHRDCGRIREFLHQRDIHIVETPGHNLYDSGGYLIF
jgi:hypothetical protein